MRIPKKFVKAVKRYARAKKIAEGYFDDARSWLLGMDPGLISVHIADIGISGLPDREIEPYGDNGYIRRISDESGELYYRIPGSDEYMKISWDSR